MEVAKLVLEYLKAVIWPATAIGLVWFLRAHLGEAFRRLTRVETPIGAVDFEVDARHLRERADELVSSGPEPEPEPESEPEPEPESRRGLDSWDVWSRRLVEANQLAAVSPMAGIVVAYEVVRDAAEEVLPVDWMGPPHDRRRNFVNGMVRAGMSPSSVDMLRELGRLRTRAVHGEPVSIQGALEFVSAAHALSFELASLRSPGVPL